MAGPRAVFYRHPYATMVTGVFLFSLLVTAAYVFGLIPGISSTRAGLERYLLITLTLLLTTVVSWAVALTSTAVAE